MIRQRDALVEERTRLINQIHSHLHQRGISLDAETDPGRQRLREEMWGWLAPEQQALVETPLELIDTLTPQMEELDGRVKEMAGQHPVASLLQTIPGIGPYRSLTLVGESPPIERFPTEGELVSYMGLAPMNRNTAGKLRNPGLSEDGNWWAKDVLESIVLAHKRAAPDSSLSEHYDRKAEGGAGR